MLTLYVEGRSPVHRLHGVAKVLGLVCVFVSAFLTDRPVALLPLVGAALALGAVAGALGVLWRLRFLFAIVFVVTAATWPFFYAEPLRYSPAGLHYGLSMGLKLWTFLLCGLLFLATTRVEELASALRTLRVPYHLGFTLTLAVRLVPVFFGAALAVRDAQRCRGLDFGRGSVVVRARRYGGLIVPVFLTALRRADRMAMALEIRGFNAGRPRTAYPGPAFGLGDALGLGAAAAVAAAYVWLWYAGVTRLHL
jgi:energy-coupling factor transport system permease protein